MSNIPAKDGTGAVFQLAAITLPSGAQAQAIVLVGSDGNPIASWPLPTGAATEASLAAILAKLSADPATQTTLAAVLAKLSADPATQTTLAAILTKLNASLAVTGTFWQATQPISAASLPLPTGAATEANQLPLASNYLPGYDAQPEGTARPMVEGDGATRVRSVNMTDEGGYRVNFSGSSLAKSIGLATFTNGSASVPWTPAADYDLHMGDYVFLDADGAANAIQVKSFTESEITLVEPYASTGGTGASSRQLLDQHVGAGGVAPTVANGACSFGLGTTSGSIVELRREVDYLPIVKQCGVTISQRIANQAIRIGVSEGVDAPRWFAWFLLDGTTNTTVKCQTARSSTGAPSAAETEETTVTIPNGKTSAVAIRYRVECYADRVNFYIEGVLVATHTRSLPNPADMLTSKVSGINTGTPGSPTTVTLDYDYGRNFNVVDIYPASDNSTLVVQQPPAQPFSFTSASIVAINTNLLVIDCSQLRSLSIQCTSMGTTGVVTPAWSNDGVNYVAASLMTPAGAAASTFNAAGIWNTRVFGRYMRLRMTTATTAGTTTLAVFGFQSDTGQPTAQPVNGTVTVGSITAGTNAIGDVGIQYRGSATGGASITSVLSPATPAATVCRSGAGRLIGWNLLNSSAAVRSVKFWNTAQGSVTLGTTAAIFEVDIPAGGRSEFNLPGGIAFTTAITYAVTGAKGLTDNTGSLGANDVSGVLFYA